MTEKVAHAVKESGVAEGVCHVYVPHTTAGVTINEGADPDVARDIEKELTRMVPKDGDFEHAEGNSDSHIKTSLVGPACAVPVRNGRLGLGRWQAIFLCEWGGPVEKFIGDAVMAVFGVPTVREDDAERALSAAMEMVDRLEALNRELQARHGLTLRMRIGVNTGEVVTGTPGETGQRLVSGDPVNVAARLQGEAEPDTILAGERTYLAARHSIKF